MAVLGDRATNVLDMIIEGYRRSGQTMEQPNMSQVAPTPLQQAMNRPVSRLTSTGDVSTIMPDGGGVAQTSVPLMQDLARGRVLNPINPMQDMGQPMAVPQAIGQERLRAAAQQPQATSDPMGMGKLAEDADRLVKAGAADSQDPSIRQRIQEVFGGRENMLRLAMAFNTMRLEPDAQLTAALSKQLETLDKNRVAQMSQGDIINYLQQKGYPQLATVAAQSPKMAQTIMEQVLQKELKPAASAKPFSPIQDPTSGQMSIPVYDPETNTTKLIPIEGAVTETPADKARRETEEAVRLNDLNEGRKAADSAFERANLYRNDINQLYQALAAAENPNTQTGVLQNFLPAFTSSTAALREAGNRLGLGVVSSVTFGALSASELDLALKTGLDLTLPRPELIKEIERRIQAQEKLYEEMMKDAELLASGIGKKEYIRVVAERRKRNKTIAGKLSELQQKVPAITKGAWRKLNSDQQMQMLESNGIVVEFVQ